MTTALSAEETHKASNEALKTIYLVVAGLTITQALEETFVGAAGFVGGAVFESENLPRFFLLLAFLPTVVRFVHGASLVLDIPDTKRFKSLFDFAGFLLQAGLFYVMALSLDDESRFSFFLILMLVADAVWILVLVGLKFIPFLPTDKQWVASDLVLALFLSFTIEFGSPGTLGNAAVVAGAAWLAAAADYAMNREFYFPENGPAKPKQTSVPEPSTTSR